MENSIGCRLHLIYLLHLVFLVLIPAPHTKGETSYDAALRLSNEKLASNKYKPDLRPIVNQTETMRISVGFGLIAIIEINDVAQKFIVNGFMGVSWMDQLFTWDPRDYENVLYLTPAPSLIWRPRMFLLNTLDKRDLFEDDASPLTILYTGEATWNPGSLFPSSCELDLQKYPFDKQTCRLQLCPMSHPNQYLKFVTSEDSVDMTRFVTNDEWEVTGTVADTFEIMAQNSVLTCVYFEFDLKRRPTFFVVNIILPVVLLSLLNMLVFTIPEESGEKIGYSITVLLSLTVYMSQVSGMVPRSSDQLPYVTFYLFLLLILSVLSVIVTIVNVFVHHKAECKTKQIKAMSNFKKTVNKFSAIRLALDPDDSRIRQVRLNPLTVGGMNSSSDSYLPSQFTGRNSIPPTSPTNPNKAENNRYGTVAQYINKVSLCVFVLCWSTVTIWYFTSVLH